MLCFKGKSTQALGVSTDKVALIVILNRKQSTSIFKQLSFFDSHLQNARFIYSTLKFIADSIRNISPILDHSKGNFYWLKASNLITETTLDGHMYVRYRFIDTTTPSKLPDETKSQIIKQAFYFIKRFYYGGKSCKEIVLDGHDNGYLKALGDNNHFPRDYRRIYYWLSERAGKSHRVEVSDRSDHIALLKMAAINYCREKVIFDTDSLNALLEMTGLLFEEDQYFRTDEVKSEFVKAFESDSFQVTAFKGVNKAERNIITNEEFEYQKKLVEKVPDEPLFNNASKAGKSQLIRRTVI